MIAVCVRFLPHPGQSKELLEKVKSQASNTLRLETGCLRFDVCTDGDDPNEIFLYELYEDHNAFQDHLESPHFLSFDASARDMIAEKTVHVYGKVTNGQGTSYPDESPDK